MRVMIILYADKDTESGVIPDTKMFEEMGRFNEELVEAGIMLDGEGLHPSSKGKRVRFSGEKREVIDGPFGRPESLIAGYWIWKVNSIDEAVSWVKRIPSQGSGESLVEIRPIYEEQDFGKEFTPELKEQERRLRSRIAYQKQKGKLLKENPYLNFNGNTEEAFMFYKSVFGGEFSALLRFKDMPQGQTPVAEQEKERILHIALPIGEDTVLMGSDISESMGQKLTTGNNIYISLQTGSKEEAERLYNALSAGGKIEMPLQKMFWGAYFASFSDKFGVQWMINYKEK